MFNDFLTLRTDFSTAPVEPTPALLALKRFIRGPLRQFGLGLVSFVLAFSLTAYLPAVAGHTSAEQPGRSAVSTATAAAKVLDKVPSAQRSKDFGKFDLPRTADNSTATHSVLARPSVADEPRRVLSYEMTGHRLTGARLSLPLTDRREIASLSEDG